MSQAPRHEPATSLLPPGWLQLGGKAWIPKCGPRQWPGPSEWGLLPPRSAGSCPLGSGGRAPGRAAGRNALPWGGSWLTQNSSFNPRMVAPPAWETLPDPRGLGPAWLPGQARTAALLTLAPGLRPPPGSPPRRDIRRTMTWHPLSWGCVAPALPASQGRGEGQGELKPSRCVGIRATFLARAEPPRPRFASEDIYCPLPSRRGRPAAAAVGK